MTRFLAIDFNQSPPATVLARVQREKPIEILSVGSLSTSSPSASPESFEGEARFAPEDSTVGDYSTIKSSESGFDRAMAVLDSGNLVYSSLELPFNDPKKLAQIVPMQLQDVLPFEVADCVLDTHVTGEGRNSTYRILAAISSSHVIAGRLEELYASGIDPIRLSTHASMLAELYERAAEPSPGLTAILNVQEDFIALVVYRGSTPCAFREWRRNSHESLKDSLAQVRATISIQEQEYSERCSCVYAIGSNEMLENIQKEIRLPIRTFKLDSLVENHTDSPLALDKYCWAIGLALQDAHGGREHPHSFDLRVGQFAYQRAWTSIWDALRLEVHWLFLLVLFASGLLGAKWFSVQDRLEKVEQQIQEVAAAASTVDPVPKRRELEFFEELVENRETQLREMGSLASLSPLESLRLLSTTIPKEIEVEIDSITIGFSRILLRGTVAELPSLGRLETALKTPSQEFCSVRVDPKERVQGSSRQRFVAEIDVCE